MIKLISDNIRTLIIKDGGEKVYEGDNNISAFLIKFPETIKDKPIDMYGCDLRVYLDDDHYIKYTLDTSKKEGDTVDIGLDITDEPRTVMVMLVYTEGEKVLGKTNTVDLKVWNAPGKVEVKTRTELEEELAEINDANEELEAVLNGTYVEPDTNF
jgi:hypothetical protein